MLLAREMGAPNSSTQTGRVPSFGVVLIDHFMRVGLLIVACGLCIVCG